MRELERRLRAVMPDESPIDLDEHARLVAREIKRARQHKILRKIMVSRNLVRRDE